MRASALAALLEADSAPSACLFETLGGSLPSAVDGVQQSGHVARVWVSLVDGRGEERAGKGAGIDMRSLRHAIQLGGTLAIETTGTTGLLTFFVLATAPGQQCVAPFGAVLVDLDD